jgi:predicted 3-demethylubiquinone-9 3-methyltransferase (glyoxalase superfamily)
MQKITPHLWFDKEAKEAARFYTSVFPSSKINSITTMHDTPSGDCDVVSFELAGQSFMSISAGPDFKFTPAISFMVACKTKEEVDTYWKKLNEGGQALMPLDQYPFSERYGWTQDRYGLSWQIMYVTGEVKQTITPALMFVGDVAGRAEKAMQFYTTLFKDSRISTIMRYEEGKGPDPAGTVAYASFTLAGQEFAAMDSAHQHHFNFNEAVSLMVHCKDQHEIDHYWTKMSAVPEAEQCGWLKDKFGVSWQIVPASMEQMMADKDTARVDRLTQAFLKMKKFDLAELERAYRGEVGVHS